MPPTADSMPLGRAASGQNTHRHRLTLHTPPQTMDSKKRENSARTMTAGPEKLSDKETDRAAMAQSEEAPWQPQKNRRTQWSLTRTYSQNGDDGCARSLASRPKNIRMQGTSLTVHEDGPVERRPAGTAWNTTEENQPEASKV